MFWYIRTVIAEYKGHFFLMLSCSVKSSIPGSVCSQPLMASRITCRIKNCWNALNSLISVRAFKHANSWHHTTHNLAAIKYRADHPEHVTLNLHAY